MKRLTLILAGVSISLSMSGCGLMEDAFKAGVIITLVVAALIGLLIWIFHITWKILTKYFPSIRSNFEGIWEELGS